MNANSYMVITGGQTGVDLGAWDAGKQLGTGTCGYMPKGYLTEAGPKPEYRDLYGACALDCSYAGRTKANLEYMAQVVVIVYRYWNSSGTQWTEACARKYKVPLFQLPYTVCEIYKRTDTDDGPPLLSIDKLDHRACYQIADEIKRLRAINIMFAGHRETVCPLAYQAGREAAQCILERLID